MQQASPEYTSGVAHILQMLSQPQSSSQCIHRHLLRIIPWQLAQYSNGLVPAQTASNISQRSYHLCKGYKATAVLQPYQPLPESLCSQTCRAGHRHNSCDRMQHHIHPQSPCIAL